MSKIHANRMPNFFWINTLAPGRFECLLQVIIKPILMTDGLGISYGIDLRWISLNFTDAKSTLVQVIAWRHQATSHYLSQCWPRSNELRRNCFEFWQRGCRSNNVWWIFTLTRLARSIGDNNGKWYKKIKISRSMNDSLIEINSNQPWNKTKTFFWRCGFIWFMRKFN